MKNLILAMTLLSNAVFADTFIELAKKTGSNYTMTSDIDENNSTSLGFEILLSGQKALLAVQAKKLNSSVFTLVNSDPALKSKVKSLPPVINVNNLEFGIDQDLTPTPACDGSGTSGTSCASGNCNMTQRVIAACNQSNCWDEDSSTDREVTGQLSEAFNLRTLIDVTTCIPGNLAGQKHTLDLKVTNASATVLSGGTLNLTLMLKNDVLEAGRK